MGSSHVGGRRPMSENGMDRPRSRPQWLSYRVRGGLVRSRSTPCLAQPLSCSDRHRNRYGQEHASHDRPRFVRRHRVAREGLARTHCIEACEPTTLPHWHRSGDGNALCCSRACRAWPRCEAGSATYAKPFRQGHKNDFRDAHAVAEAVQRPTTRFVPAKTNEQLDLQALHRVRSRLVSERTAVINQIRGFLLERGIIVRQGLRFSSPGTTRHPGQANGRSFTTHGTHRH